MKSLHPELVETLLDNGNPSIDLPVTVAAPARTGVVAWQVNIIVGGATDFILYGSLDGSSWIIIDTLPGVTTTAANQVPFPYPFLQVAYDAGSATAATVLVICKPYTVLNQTIITLDPVFNSLVVNGNSHLNGSVDGITSIVARLLRSLANGSGVRLEGNGPVIRAYDDGNPDADLTVIPQGSGSIINDGPVILNQFLSGSEQADPAAPAANGYKLYARDNGGKTELVVRFNTGAIQQVAIEP